MLGHVEHYERGIGAAIIVVGVLLWIWHHVGRRRCAGEGTPPPHSR